MSLSAEYCCDKTRDRGGGGGAVAHQRRLIRGLLVWVTLLTVGLAASIILHFIPRVPQVWTGSVQKLSNASNSVIKEKNIQLMTFIPSSENKGEVELIDWNTVHNRFIEGKKHLKVKEIGMYFLYLQVTLEAPASENQIINVQIQYQNETILRGNISGSKISTGLMGTGISLDSGATFTVSCKPKAKIQNSHLDTYLGVIKLE